MSDKIFDENKEYGNSLIIHDENDIDKAKDVVSENMKATIPKEFQDFTKIVIYHQKAVTIKVKEDNLEQLGATKEEIGKILDIPEYWSVGWHYSQKYKLARAES